MVWFFDKDGRRLRYEIRRIAAAQYELGVTFPDGRVEREQVADAADLLDRCARLAQTLKSGGWNPS